MPKQKGNVPRHHVERMDFDGWVLFEKFSSDQAIKWRSFKLVWCGRERIAKANFWLGWDGERMARNKDTELLDAHHPELMQHLLHWMKTQCPGT